MALDQAVIEQKIGPVVRRIVGYARLKGRSRSPEAGVTKDVRVAGSCLTAQLNTSGSTQDQRSGNRHRIGITPPDRPPDTDAGALWSFHFWQIRRLPRRTGELAPRVQEA
jgi:hypothetical protein